MQIGILEAGKLPPSLESRFGSYPEMIRTGMGPIYCYRTFEVWQGDIPGTNPGADAYIITGSTASAYEADAWIGRLMDWLRKLDPSVPLIGICFGHQIMAQAYGGRVKKASQGPAVGLQAYRVSAHTPWMDGVERFAIPVLHYDQIAERPAGARTIATNDLCPHAALAYDDRCAISFQGHPEFSLELTEVAIDRWLRKGLIGEAQAIRASESLRAPDDRSRVMGWMGRFLTQSWQRTAPGRTGDSRVDGPGFIEEQIDPER
jgi:GMP synthase-like glutamine amidotransferase